jgi:glycosyltransferase involved in cell wall biosynthesis
MRSISVDSVMDAVERQLRSPKKILATMLTFNLLSWTKVAIDSLRSFHDLDLFVIDNESTDGTQQWLTEQGIEFISKRSSVPEAENYGVKKFLAGDYDYFLLLNNDICLRHDAIDKLVEHIEQEGGNSAITGITSWVVEETPFYSVDDAAPRDRQIETIVDLPHSAFSCTLFSRKAIEEVGQFDERFGPRYIEDNDYILRLRLAGGKFLRVHDSLYYHVLGGVVKTDEDEKKGYDANWNKNCNAFTAKWGITPHEHQMLSKVQAVPECKTLMDRIAWESSRRVFRLGIKRWMGGAGDHIFLSAIARHVRKLAPNCHIIYIVPHQFKDVYDCCPYIDVATSDEAVKTDLTIDCTDLDYKVEKYEMAKYGHIISPRSKIYLDYLGIKTDDIKLDFFVSDAEKRWGEGQWLPRSRGLVRVVVASKASNMMMTWPHTDAFVTLLEKAGKYDIKIADAQSNGRYLLSFRQACSVLATADAYVGPNSSFSNVAGAMGIPAITLFSSRNGENMARMYSSMIPVQGDCSVKEGSHYCDYATPCILPEKEYRERENTKHPDCIASIAPERVQTILEETIT